MECINYKHFLYNMYLCKLEGKLLNVTFSELSKFCENMFTLTDFLMFTLIIMFVFNYLQAVTSSWCSPEYRQYLRPMQRKSKNYRTNNTKHQTARRIQRFQWKTHVRFNFNTIYFLNSIVHCYKFDRPLLFIMVFSIQL